MQDDLHTLVQEYCQLQSELAPLMKRRVTRRHKIIHAEQLQILQRIGRLCPGKDPLTVVEQVKLQIN